jgi:triosephosphate isomerase (TIM)
MRRLIGTSLKMHFTSTEAGPYFAEVRRLTQAVASCDLFVLPPFTSIWLARETFAGSNVAWGAQDVSAEDWGAHTGDVSAPMLADLGCTYVEVGHSERRRDYGETDETVARKVDRILRHGMTAIVCVGEPAQGDATAALDHVLRELRIGLRLVDSGLRDRVIVAYEPAWAIGLGARAADPRHVAQVHRGIHEYLCSPAGGAIDARVIYGGSVDPSTAAPLLEQEGVEGLFVGRAALDPSLFARIARQADTESRSPDRDRSDPSPDPASPTPAAPSASPAPVVGPAATESAPAAPAGSP